MRMSLVLWWWILKFVKRNDFVIECERMGLNWWEYEVVCCIGELVKVGVDELLEEMILRLWWMNVYVDVVYLLNFFSCVSGIISYVRVRCGFWLLWLVFVDEWWWEILFNFMVGVEVFKMNDIIYFINV